MRLPTQFGLGLLLFAFLVMPSVCAGAENPSQPPADLVREAVQNELKASNDDLKFMFKDHKQTPRGSQTKLLVETNEGMAGLVIEQNGHPLTQAQRQAELARVDRFVTNPSELKKKQRQEKEDSDRVTRILKALPDAFLYEYDGTAPGTEGIGRPGDELIRLKFRPNPRYHPPTHVEQVLTGMGGIILIDANHHRIAQIDGTLVSSVGFGWGILGRLDAGGKFLVEQADVAANHWEISHMKLSFTGKILLIKSLVIKSDETYSDFHPVPSDLTFPQGVELLKKQEAVIADSQHGGE
jgi:hypothetical protein